MHQKKIMFFYFTIMIVFFSCARSSSKKNLEETSILLTKEITIPEANFDLTEVDVVMNATGGTGGYGDFTGPFFILQELRELDKKNEKKFFPNDSIAIIIDKYTYDYVLKKIYKFNSLDELNERFKVNFITLNQSKKIKNAKYIFEFFSGGRKKDHQENHPYRTDNTILIVSDPMHIKYAPLDFAETAPGKIIFFQPPGIGSKRSGLVHNYTVKPFLNKSFDQKKEESLNILSSGTLNDFIKSEKIKNSKLGFLYGAHNTVTRKSSVYTLQTMSELKVQTLKILLEMKSAYAPNQPLIIFSPNEKKVFDLAFSQDIDSKTKNMVNIKNFLIESTEKSQRPKIKERLDNFYKSFEVLSTDEILKKETLNPDFTYIVTTGDLSPEEFTALMSLSQTPMIIEGNSTVSTALELNQAFIMYLSPWNWENITDLISAEKKCSNNPLKLYEKVYSNGELKVPNFEIFFENLKSNEEQINYMKNISDCLDHFTPKIVNVLNTLSKSEDIDASKSDQEKKYLELANNLIDQDPYLSYSLIYNAVERGQIPSRSLTDISSKIKSKVNLDEQTMMDRIKVVYKTMKELNLNNRTDWVKRVRPKHKFFLDKKMP